MCAIAILITEAFSIMLSSRCGTNLEGDFGPSLVNGSPHSLKLSKLVNLRVHSNTSILPAETPAKFTLIEQETLRDTSIVADLRVPSVDYLYMTINLRSIVSYFRRNQVNTVDYFRWSLGHFPKA